MNKISYSGNAQDGYTATRGGDSVQVRKLKEGWEGSYAGRPTLHNPLVEGTDGRLSRSCSCPTIKVPGLYATRQRAAEMAMAEVEREDLVLRGREIRAKIKPVPFREGY